MVTWVFLRGLTRESRHWSGFIETFEQVLQGNQVVTLDLFGNGVLNHQTSPCRVTDMVEQCRAQLLGRGIDPPFHLLALSLGGMVSVAWSQTYPHEVAVQVLINTSMRPFSPFYQRLKPSNYAALLKLMLLNAHPQQQEQAILELTSQKKDVTVLPHWVALRLANPVSGLNALRQLIAAARFRASIDPPPIPTMLLASERDQLVSVTCSKSMARQWQCALKVHTKAGHDLPLDDGSWVAWQVLAWVSELPYQR